VVIDLVQVWRDLGRTAVQILDHEFKVLLLGVPVNLLLNRVLEKGNERAVDARWVGREAACGRHDGGAEGVEAVTKAMIRLFCSSAILLLW
jgi:hypothetical protein